GGSIAKYSRESRRIRPQEACAPRRSVPRADPRAAHICAPRRPVRREEGAVDSAQIVAQAARPGPAPGPRPSAVGVAEVADERAGHLGEGTGGLEDPLQALV